MSQEQKVDNRSASQKISDLEAGVVNLYGTVDNMARDLLTIKEILKVLDNKVKAIVQASSAGQALNDDVISKIMTDNTVEELKSRVTNMVAQGRLKASEQVDDNSFLVGTVENESGETVNPRLQFAVQALPQEGKDKVRGAKVGDLLKILSEQDLSFKVSEVYSIEIVQEETPEAPAPEQTAPSSEASAPTAEAPVVESTAPEVVAEAPAAPVPAETPAAAPASA